MKSRIFKTRHHTERRHIRFLVTLYDDSDWYFVFGKRNFLRSSNCLVPFVGCACCLFVFSVCKESVDFWFTFHNRCKRTTCDVGFTSIQRQCATCSFFIGQKKLIDLSGRAAEIVCVEWNEKECFACASQKFARQYDKWFRKCLLCHKQCWAFLFY